MTNIEGQPETERLRGVLGSILARLEYKLYSMDKYFAVVPDEERESTSVGYTSIDYRVLEEEIEDTKYAMEHVEDKEELKRVRETTTSNGLYLTLCEYLGIMPESSEEFIFPEISFRLKVPDSRVHYEHLISDITSYIESNGFRVLEASTTLPGDGGLVVRESHVQEPIIITEEMDIHKQWYEESRQITLDALPDFISHLINDYQHDYGTVCHALAAGALATLWAMNSTPQGGITGFQASAIMWQLIRQWSYPGNKTGLRIIDYDKFLYPQYEDDFTQKAISKSMWECIQKEAENNIKEADEAHAKYLVDMEQYEKDLAVFVEKYPDYYDRKDYYDHLSYGTGDEWDEYNAKVDSGFEFAPEKPYVHVDLEGAVYKHWKSIVAGVVPFGYTIGED